MDIKAGILKFIDRKKERLYHRLSRPNTLLQPALLGILVGVLSGACIVLFRLVIELTQRALLPDGGTENYEALDPWVRFVLPIAASALIVIFVVSFTKKRVNVGLIAVLERMSYHEGKMSWRALLMQFVGGALAIAGGHSGGREGPSVHLGAASASLLGQYLHLPNNMIRTLAGSGSAAAIAASFNTPLAGVIFAMEVVMLEYTLTSFVPVMLAAVSGTVFSIFIFGDSPVFLIPEVRVSTLREIPLIIILGFTAGIVSTIFINIATATGNRTKEWPYSVKIMVAGLLIGFGGVAVPQILSMGYDTVNLAIIGEIGVLSLMLFLVAKLLASGISVGLGVPAGFIGPVMFMGAMLGGGITYLQLLFFPELESDSGLFAIIGMGAMMAGALQAPLAALMALLELTSNTGIIFPGMLAIVVAELTRSELFHQPSIFRALFRARGLEYQADPMTIHLHRIGVFGVMSKNFVRASDRCDRAEADALLKDSPRFIVISRKERISQLMPAVDLARYLEENPGAIDINMLEIPAKREELSSIHRGATLYEARNLMKQKATSALYVYDTPAPNIKRIRGIIRASDIEDAYLY